MGTSCPFWRLILFQTIHKYKSFYYIASYISTIFFFTSSACDILDFPFCKNILYIPGVSKQKWLLVQLANSARSHDDISTQLEKNLSFPFIPIYIFIYIFAALIQHPQNSKNMDVAKGWRANASHKLTGWRSLEYTRSLQKMYQVLACETPFG